MKIAIVDDEPQDCELVCHLLEEMMPKYQVDYTVTCFESGEAFLSANVGDFDVCFLDIFMGGMNGMEVAKQIQRERKLCRVIFLTTSSDYQEESYDVKALRYMQKPLTAERLRRVMEDVMEVLALQGRQITITVDRQPMRIPIAGIEAVIASGREILFHSAKSELCSRSHSSFEEVTATLFLDGSFVLAGRGVVLSLRLMKSVEKDGVLMKSGNRYPVTRRKLAEVKLALAEFKFRWDGESGI